MLFRSYTTAEQIHRFTVARGYPLRFVETLHRNLPRTVFRTMASPQFARYMPPAMLRILLPQGPYESEVIGKGGDDEGVERTQLSELTGRELQFLTDAVVLRQVSLRNFCRYHEHVELGLPCWIDQVE